MNSFRFGLRNATRVDICELVFSPYPPKTLFREFSHQLCHSWDRGFYQGLLIKLRLRAADVNVVTTKVTKYFDKWLAYWRESIQDKPQLYNYTLTHIWQAPSPLETSPCTHWDKCQIQDVGLNTGQALHTRPETISATAECNSQQSQDQAAHPYSGKNFSVTISFGVHTMQ